MTTINNLTIEQMREIVNRAPEGAVSVNLHNGMYYELREYKRGDTFLSEIREAIAKHDTTDHVTDIRNHVSPSTIIKDLEAERHG